MSSENIFVTANHPMVLSGNKPLSVVFGTVTLDQGEIAFKVDTKFTAHTLHSNGGWLKFADHTDVVIQIDELKGTLDIGPTDDADGESTQVTIQYQRNNGAQVNTHGGVKVYLNETD